jgi:hypothetical protein
VIQNRISMGMLDDTSLTLHDLETIADSFTTTLRGVYHPRIEYPILEKGALPASESVPTLPATTHSNPEALPSTQPGTPSSPSQSTR